VPENRDQGILFNGSVKKRIVAVFILQVRGTGVFTASAAAAYSHSSCPPPVLCRCGTRVSSRRAYSHSPCPPPVLFRCGAQAFSRQAPPPPPPPFSAVRPTRPSFAFLWAGASTLTLGEEHVCVFLCGSPAGPSPPVIGALWLGLYKIFVYVEAVVHESNTLRPHPPICIGNTVAILLHGYWAVQHTFSTPLSYAI